MLAKIHDRLKEQATGFHKREEKPLDAQGRIEKRIYVRTKDKTVVPLAFNPIQNDYWSERSPRDIILKPRQLGFSTLVLAEFFDDTINNPNTNTVIVAHDADSTRKLFNAVQFMYDNLPESKKQQLNNGRSRPKYGNRKEYYFESINSRIEVGTAGSTDFGRGSTINNLHCSEVAFWPDPETLMTGLLQAVPYDGRVVIETTANGVGNYFYRTYEGAKKGEGRWKPHFYRWFDHPDYKLALEPGERLEPTREEKRLIGQHELTPEQIKWRRWKISEMPEKDGLSKEERFLQEYPEDDTSCFLSSGRPVFNLRQIKQLIEVAKQRPYESFDIDYESRRVYTTDASQPELKIWKQPVPGKRYVLACDVAEGKAGGDYSAGHVIDWDDNEQVAEIHGHWDPDIFGKKLAVVGWYYNTALIGVERNNHGHSVLNTLINQVGYENLYYHVDYDSASGEEKKEPGWPTNKKTRPVMMSDLRAVMREVAMILNSTELLEECFTFIVNDKGKEEAQSGCHDDLVMALAIAIQLRKYMPAPEYASLPTIGGW